MQTIYLLVLTVFASVLGTITGFGISTVMVPVVLLILPLPETLLFVGVVHWFGDLWKIFLFKHGINWKLLLWFGIPGVIGSSLGAMAVVKLPEVLVSRFIGTLLVVYVVYLLKNPNFKIKPSNKIAFLGGAGSGLLGGVSGVGGGALRAVVLTAFNIEKNSYIFLSGLLGTVIDASRLTTYVVEGTRISQNLMYGMILFIPASFLGAKLAKRWVDKINQKTFKLLLAAFLFIIGAKFIIWP